MDESRHAALYIFLATMRFIYQLTPQLNVTNANTNENETSLKRSLESLYIARVYLGCFEPNETEIHISNLTVSS